MSACWSLGSSRWMLLLVWCVGGLVLAVACRNSGKAHCDPGSGVDVQVLVEPSVAILSGVEVGVSNISGRTNSVRFDILHEPRIEFVAEGRVLVVGADSYCVVEVSPGRPGHVAVKKLRR